MNFSLTVLFIVIVAAATTIAKPPVVLVHSGFVPEIFSNQQPRLLPVQTSEFNYQESAVPDALIENVRNQLGTVINKKIAYTIINYVPIKDEIEEFNFVWTMEQLPLRFNSYVSQDMSKGKMMIFNVGVGLQCFLVKICEDSAGKLTFVKTYQRPVACKQRIFNFQ